MFEQLAGITLMLAHWTRALTYVIERKRNTAFVSAAGGNAISDSSTHVQRDGLVV